MDTPKPPNSNKFTMNRRSFLYGSTATLMASPLSRVRADMLAGSAPAASAGPVINLFVSLEGDDSNPGTADRPLRTLKAAQTSVRALRKGSTGAITVYLRQGTHYLDQTVIFTAEDSAEQQAPVLYESYPGERVTLSGGARLNPRWRPYRNGILQSEVPPGTRTDQLFVNGRRQILARYPNYDPQAKYLNGWAPDASSPERVSTWSNPKGGYIHALHQYLWGDLHFQITGKDVQGNLTYEGGWQNNRPKPMHAEYRFVENIFEELDAPGEWFLDETKNTLYFYPPVGIDLNNAIVETVRLKHLVEFHGSESEPVKWITLKGFIFQHSARTFMETRDPLLRSDWRIYRGGAVFLNGTEDCHIDACFFNQLGGNCIFVNHYNRRARISRCHIAEAGANGVSFVGDRAAVRNPLDDYDERLAVNQLDMKPGPLTRNYPADCIVEDSLIYQTGRVEKQSAPVEISMSMSITVRHVSIYDVPRAGINIGDGCWGGHRIEYCDVFDTVKETGDHGSFNSWGRDRWWGTKGIDLDKVLTGEQANLPVLDAIEPNILSNSRWRCDHGWDIDLDDGSSNYRIYNNLCLNGGLKLREGFYRICENNVLVNNSLHAHVWFNDSHDVFRSNIVCTPYRPIGMRKWTQQIDFNLLNEHGQSTPIPAKPLQELSGDDTHSLVADARFIDAAAGDYRVKLDSPALTLGFVNFDMRNFGVQAPELKAIARTPELPSATGPRPVTLDSSRSRTIVVWQGTKVRNIVGLGEVSAAGTPGESGVIVLAVPAGSPAGTAGITAGDVILGFNNKPVKDTQDLLRYTREAGHGSRTSIAILRYQQQSTVSIALE
ncbi:MAG TPA: PDZ domain-containing protein [Edaphobacter sp.]|nr:PDZ domain-containing protein [Edaphobacter sp.]